MYAALEQAVADAMRAHPEVAVLYLFGSRARGDATPESDVDLGVVYAHPTSADGQAEVAAALEKAAGRAFDTDRVDVVDLAAQGPIFCHRVLLDGRRVFVADESRRIDFESDVLSRAIDFRPTWEAATRGKATALRRFLRKRHDPRADSVEAGRPQGESREAG